MPGGVTSSSQRKKWVTALRRACLLRRKSGRPTRGRGCSSSAEGEGSASWPTPNATDFKGPSTRSEGKERPPCDDDLPTRAANWQDEGPHLVQGELWGTPTSHERPHTARDVHHGKQLANQVELWSTPLASDSLGEMHQSDKAVSQGWAPRIQDQAREMMSDKEKEENILPVQRQLWATPNVPNGGRSPAPDYMTETGLDREGKKRSVHLEEQVGLWATPAASVANDGESLESWEARKKKNLEKHCNGNGMGTPLTIMAVRHDKEMMWATPHANCTTGEGHQGRDGSPNLQTQACSFPQGPPSESSGPESSQASPNSPPPCPKEKKKKVYLSPEFVEWLMGLPFGWTKITEPTGSEPSATAASPSSAPTPTPPCQDSLLREWQGLMRKRLNELLSVGGGRG